MQEKELQLSATVNTSQQSSHNLFSKSNSFPQDSKELSLSIKNKSKKIKKQLTAIEEARTSLECETEEKTTKENIFSQIAMKVFGYSFCLFCLFLIETINLMFMGATKENNVNININSVGLGNLFLNIFGVIIGMGIIREMDRSLTTAFHSYKFDKFGLFIVRTRIILIGLFFILIFPMSLLSERLLLGGLNLEPKLASTSSNYIIRVLPGIFLAFNFFLNLRYLQIIKIYLIPSLIMLSAVFIHILMAYFFIFIFEMNTEGVAYASNITLFYCFLFSTIYILIANPVPKSLYYFPPATAINSEEFLDFLKSSIVSGVKFFLQWVGLFLSIIICAYLSETSLAASVIIFNYINTTRYFYLGFSYPLSYMVQEFVPTRNFEMYKYALNIFTWIFILTASVLGVVTFFCSDNIGFIYTNNPEICKKVSEVLLMWTVGVVSDNFNVMFQAIMKGLRKEYFSYKWNILMGLLFVNPGVSALTFYFNLDLYGIWLVNISNICILTFIYFCYFLFLDVNSVSTELADTIDKEEQSAEGRCMPSRFTHCSEYHNHYNKLEEYTQIEEENEFEGF